MSELVSETPSRPDSWFTRLSNSSAVIPSARDRNRTSPGSRSPVRVPMTSPEAGVKPMTCRWNGLPGPQPGSRRRRGVPG